VVLLFRSQNISRREKLILFLRFTNPKNWTFVKYCQRWSLTKFLERLSQRKNKSNDIFFFRWSHSLLTRQCIDSNYHTQPEPWEMSTFTTLQNISQYSRFIYPQILHDSIRTQENEGQRCIVRWMLHIALINSLVVFNNMPNFERFSLRK